VARKDIYQRVRTDTGNKPRLGSPEIDALLCNGRRIAKTGNAVGQLEDSHGSKRLLEAMFFQTRVLAEKSGIPSRES
jgi:hypothetical protein